MLIFQGQSSTKGRREWRLVVRCLRRATVLPDRGAPIDDPWLLTWFAPGRAMRDVLPSASLRHALAGSLARLVEADDRGLPDVVVVDGDAAFDIIEDTFAGVVAVRRGLVPGAPDAHHEHLAALRVNRHPSIASVYELGARPETVGILAAHAVALHGLERWHSAAVSDASSGWLAELDGEREPRRIRIYRTAADRAGLFATSGCSPAATAVDGPVAFDVSVVAPSLVPPGWRLDAFRDRLPRALDGKLVRVAAVGGRSVHRSLLEREARFVLKVLAKLHAELA